MTESVESVLSGLLARAVAKARALEEAKGISVHHIFISPVAHAAFAGMLEGEGGPPKKNSWMTAYFWRGVLIAPSKEVPEGKFWIVLEDS